MIFLVLVLQSSDHWRGRASFRHGNSTFHLFVFFVFALDNHLEVLLELVLREEVLLLARQVTVPQCLLQGRVIPLERLWAQHIELFLPEKFFLPELLLVKLLERNGAGRRVVGVSLEGHVGDQRADVLLKFREIGDYVVLGKDNSIAIVHLGRDRKEELGVDERSDHVFNWLLHLSEHFLRLLDLVVPTVIITTNDEFVRLEAGQKARFCELNKVEMIQSKTVCSGSHVLDARFLRG